MSSLSLLMLVAASVLNVQAFTVPDPNVLEYGRREADVPKAEIRCDTPPDYLKPPTSPLNRHKRTLTKYESQRWDHGIVPYVFYREILPKTWISDILRNFAAYERFTCLRFYPRFGWGPGNQTLNDAWNLGHQGYTYYVNWDDGKCWSDLGKKMNGPTRTQCCSDTTCMHEIGHSLGAYHEHQNPLMVNWVRKNTEFIYPGYRGAYELREDTVSTGYDIQSVMHYNIHAFASKGPAMEIKDDSIRGADVDTWYYLMQEISLFHHCHTQNCTEFNKQHTCESDGYVTVVDGRCSCRCVIGLDPETDCKTIIGTDLGKWKNVNNTSDCETWAKAGWCTTKYDFMLTNCQATCGYADSWMKHRPWPKGNYALPMTADGCPFGHQQWENGQLTTTLTAPECKNHYGDDYCRDWAATGLCKSNYQFMLDHCGKACGHCDNNKVMDTDTYNLQHTSALSYDSLDLSFCVNNGTVKDYKFGGMNESQYDEYEWPHGNFCIYRYGGTCPKGFESGSLELPHPNGTALESGLKMDGVFNSTYSRYEFCCMFKGYASDPIVLPATRPFALFMSNVDNGKCQEVSGMRAYYESRRIYIADAGKQMKGSVPVYARITRDNVYIMRHCYYKPTTNCGEIITLTKENNTVKFSPKSVGANHQCFWQIKAPKGTRIIMKFEAWSVPCPSKVHTRTNRLGQRPDNGKCGPKPPKTYFSDHNEMMVELGTWGTQTASNFTAVVSLVYEDNVVYNWTDKGASYRGKHNYTQNFQQCMNWADVTKCPHHAFRVEDKQFNLEGNYCRNPDGSAAPWCYNSATWCQRDYCEPSLHLDAYDTKGGCGPNNCTGNITAALNQCAGTCKDTLARSMIFRTREKLATDVSCGPPPALPDGDPPAHVKSTYSMGEKVEYSCKNDANATKVLNTCLSTGEWTRLSACKQDAANVPCYDELLYCHDLVAKHPNVCKDQSSFMETSCRKTCGKCS